MLPHDEIVVRFRRYFLHFAEDGFSPPKCFPLPPYYRAMCRIAEIDCTSAELRAIFPKLIVSGAATNLWQGGRIKVRQTHLPQNSNFSSDFGHFISKILENL